MKRKKATCLTIFVRYIIWYWRVSLRPCDYPVIVPCCLLNLATVRFFRPISFARHNTTSSSQATAFKHLNEASGISIGRANKVTHIVCFRNWSHTRVIIPFRVVVTRNS